MNDYRRCKYCHSRWHEGACATFEESFNMSAGRRLEHDRGLHREKERCAQLVLQAVAERHVGALWAATVAWQSIADYESAVSLAFGRAMSIKYGYLKHYGPMQPLNSSDEARCWLDITTETHHYLAIILPRWATGHGLSGRLSVAA